ncbi:hypothetical protein CDL15_Pgr021748 [Punica granatum]|uniref:S-type anion channel SLAH2-like n=1 Tax=Punica granatum TaxID=22663 RepID=A0A218WRV5_PUNGR|nr:hypothetical protein CDL15_Pgr021748 [Punica granatum]
MENHGNSDPIKQDSPEGLPSLIQVISSNGVSGFDSIEGRSDQFLGPSVQETARGSNSKLVHAVSISMPSSPREADTPNAKRVLFANNDEPASGDGNPDSTPSGHPKRTTFYSQPMPRRSGENPPRHPRVHALKDKRFDSFKTWSGKLERQLSNLRGKPRPTSPEDGSSTTPTAPERNLPASEEIVLPDDKQWPFLLRFPISSFGICLGVSSQAIMWKALATSESTNFLHVSTIINTVLWSISLALVAIVFLIYLLKVIFYFEAVRREYYHPIRVNFFFAPWIALLFLSMGVPPSVTSKLHHALWYVLMAPIFCLELKIYGQWMSGGQRRLSKVANPSNHLSIVGNFVGALLGATMGLKEGPIFFFAVGLAHYTVLFVTLYQRLPTNETLPKELHPVFFLFVAAPSVASMAWAKIQGSFDYGSRIAYFIALFLYFSLAVRVNFFRGFRFSLAWWAYTFPMTGAAIATVRYSNEVTNVVTQSLSVALSATATLTVFALLVTTILHAFVLRDLFPNDIAIAISERRPKSHHSHRKWFHLRHGSSDTRDIENYLKFATSEGKDIEASNSVDAPSPDGNNPNVQA